MIGAWLAVALAQGPVAPTLVWSGCTWTDAPFEQSTALRIAGAVEPVVDLWGSANVAVTAALGQDLALRTALAGVWRSGGVSVAGYADLADSVVLRLSGQGPVGLGPAAHLVVGGSLEPFGFVEGTPLVRAHAWARDDVKRGAGYARVPCERLSVTRAAWLDDAAIVAAVYGPGVETQLAAPGTKLRLREAPGGPVVAVLERFAHERTVWVIARTDGWSHVAVPNWTGVVWHGWVDDLPEPDGSTEGAGGLGMLGGLGVGEQVRTVACSEPRTLWVASRRMRLPLGLVDAGTVLDVGTEHPEAPEVLVSWLAAREGWWLELDAAGCTRATRAPDPPLDLGGLLATEPAATEPATDHEPGEVP